MSYESLQKTGDCYKCKKKDGIEYNIPVMSSEFYAKTGVCECGHDQTVFRPKSKERQEQLNQAFHALKEELQNE
jgi:hypothetical protein